MSYQVKIHKSFYALLVREVPTVENTICYRSRTQRNQTRTELEVPSLLASFHSARRCHAGYLVEKSILLLSCEHCEWQYQPARQNVPIGTIVAWLYKGNWCFSSWIASLLHRRYLTPGIVSLFGGKLLLTFSLMAMLCLSNCLLNITSALVWKWIPHRPSGKGLVSVYGAAGR